MIKQVVPARPGIIGPGNAFLQNQVALHAFPDGAGKSGFAMVGLKRPAGQKSICFPGNSFSNDKFQFPGFVSSFQGIIPLNKDIRPAQQRGEPGGKLQGSHSLNIVSFREVFVGKFHVFIVLQVSTPNSSGKDNWFFNSQPIS